MKETATAAFQFSDDLHIDDIKKRYDFFEDLLVLLTTKNCALDWPSVSTNNTGKCRLYFRRTGRRTTDNPPKFYECVANFTELRKDFGAIWSKWKQKREEVGPGLFFYLGTRRGLQLYLEHRFVNLVWGIEAFHRARHVPASTTRLRRKIERILNQIEGKRDQSWLSRKLQNASEPSLGERIFETLRVVPLGLEDAKLRAFADSCANLRNDISHFGGQRSGRGSYDKFLVEVHKHIEPLSILYQMLLLHEIGVRSSTLEKWIYKGFDSYRIKSSFETAGLIAAKTTSTH